VSIMVVSVAEWLPRSHIDTTAVQALIDTRTEVEKWADHPVEVRGNSLHLWLISS
jgi:sodium-independent sulfate anion transporter 11